MYRNQLTPLLRNTGPCSAMCALHRCQPINSKLSFYLNLWPFNPQSWELHLLSLKASSNFSLKSSQYSFFCFSKECHFRASVFNCLSHLVHVAFSTLLREKISPPRKKQREGESFFECRFCFCRLCEPTFHETSPFPFLLLYYTVHSTTSLHHTAWGLG